MQSVLRFLLLSILLKLCSNECVCLKNQTEVFCDDTIKVNSAKTELHTITEIQFEDKALLKNALNYNDVEKLGFRCNIQYLHKDSLSNQEFLTVLTITQTSISEIPDSFFVHLKKLEILNLSHNKLRNPTDRTFNELKNLKVLDISYNRISTIITGTLDQLNNLEELYITNNGIHAFDVGVFDELKNLKFLNLSRNHIYEIWPGVFEATKKLETVDLAGNDFEKETLPNEIFNDFKSVSTLNLSNCKIIVDRNLFDNTAKLKYLNLNFNNLQNTPENIFYNLKELEVLTLVNCELIRMPVNLFRKNSALTDLNLAQNKFRDIPDLLFDQNYGLQNLNLSLNLIRNFPSQLLTLNNLQNLDLSYNLLTTFPYELLSKPSVQKLYVNNNKISNLNMQSATHNYTNFNLRFLDIRNNRLVFLSDQFFNTVHNLEILEIFGNPWDCRCFSEIIKTLHEKNIKYNRENYYQGAVPICVDSDSIACVVDEHNLTVYYNLYQRKST